MTPDTVCRQVRSHLDEFVDGELDAGARAVVSRHLQTCDACGEQEQELRSIGGWLRACVLAAPRMDLTGLSAGVISRVGAERAQSWRASFGRAFEDWHWPLAGIGALVSGAALISFVSALLWFGTAPSRSDSLESLLNNLGEPAGTLLLVATPDGREPTLMRFHSGPMDGRDETVAIPVSFSGPAGRTEGYLAAALSEAMVGADGRVHGSGGMSPVARERTEALLDEIERLRYPAPAAWSGGAVGVLRLGLVTSTECTAKAL